MLPLVALPEDVLDRCMAILAQEAGGSAVRSVCLLLRSRFDGCNGRLVLRGPHQGDATSTLHHARCLVDLVHRSPCLHNLTLAPSLGGVTLEEVL